MRNAKPLIAVAAGYAASAAAFSRLPETRGAADVLGVPTGPLIAILLPTAAVAIYVILTRLWARDPVRDRTAAADATFESIVFRLVLFVIAIHVSLIGGLISSPIAALLPRVVAALLGGVFISVGNLLPRLTPDLVIGFQSRRTLQDRRAWGKMQRAAGYTAVSLGIVIALSAMVLPVGTPLRNVVSAAGFAAGCVLVAYSRRHARA